MLSRPAAAAAAADDDDDYDYDYNEIVDTIKYVCIDEPVCFTGCILVLLNVVNVISTVTTCYPVNGQQYCFYTDGSTVLNRDEARQFCSDRNSTLPIVTDKDIDNVFLQFISDNNLVEVSGSNTQQMNNYVWLDAHAHHVHDSDPWHWINGQPSGSSLSCTVQFTSLTKAIAGDVLFLDACLLYFVVPAVYM